MCQVLYLFTFVSTARLKTTWRQGMSPSQCTPRAEDEPLLWAEPNYTRPKEERDSKGNLIHGIPVLSYSLRVDGTSVEQSGGFYRFDFQRCSYKLFRSSANKWKYSTTGLTIISFSLLVLRTPNAFMVRMARIHILAVTLSSCYSVAEPAITFIHFLTFKIVTDITPRVKFKLNSECKIMRCGRR